MEELRELRSTWGNETQKLRAKFEPIIAEFHNKLADFEQENSAVLVKTDAGETTLTNLRERCADSISFFTLNSCIWYKRTL